MKTAKPVSAATRAMLDEMEADAKRPAGADKVEQARRKARELRDLELDKSRMEGQLKDVNARIQEIKERELVDLLLDAKLDDFTVSAEGNLPAMTFVLDDYYHANIPKENEERAYAYLKKEGMQDMIKTTYVISFGLQEAKECAAFEKKLDKIGEPYEKKQAVPWNTLTSWVKGEFKSGRPLTEKVLGILGAKVGRVVKVKPQKKEK